VFVSSLRERERERERERVKEREKERERKRERKRERETYVEETEAVEVDDKGFWPFWLREERLYAMLLHSGHTRTLTHSLTHSHTHSHTHTHTLVCM
jgi:hypothetical protein